jgi:mono/diheme cytochrome c family protein
MTRLSAIAAVALILTLAAGRQQPAAPTPRVARVAHGHYLTQHVAMCIQCHTPRDEKGDLDRHRLFRGAAIPLKSPWPDQEWAVRTPSLAGLPGGWSQDQLATFLQTGKDANGRTPKPPMPPFRLTPDDATAIAAYLRSLTETNGVTTQPGR